MNRKLRPETEGIDQEPDGEGHAHLLGCVIDELEHYIIGKRAFLQKLLCSQIAGIHVLIEDFPGLAKTLAAKSLARALGLSMKRIQFTADLLPADITGSHLLDRNTGRFEMIRGPIFANIVLADEINRASPKTQAAVLEAMEEHQVTSEGETFELPWPFMVVATQNPIEFEGTFPLPEAELDRFGLRLPIGYPEAEEEVEILTRRIERRRDGALPSQVISPDGLARMQEHAERIAVDPDLVAYIVALVGHTRTAAGVAVGASPRAGLALLKLARAKALLDGRDYVVPDDIGDFARDVLTHRILLTPDSWSTGRTAEQIVDGALRVVPVPKVAGV